MKLAQSEDTLWPYRDDIVSLRPNLFRIDCACPEAYPLVEWEMRYDDRKTETQDPDL